jgi:hypothetical protein
MTFKRPAQEKECPSSTSLGQLQRLYKDGSGLPQKGHPTTRDKRVLYNQLVLVHPFSY